MPPRGRVGFSIAVASGLENRHLHEPRSRQLSSSVIGTEVAVDDAVDNTRLSAPIPCRPYFAISLSPLGLVERNRPPNKPWPHDDRGIPLCSASVGSLLEDWD